MSIDVSGSNNRVAGRDYIENTLKLGDEELKKLGAILAEKIGALPHDGKPHSLSVTVGGDQAGNISLGGTQINIQSVSPRPRKTWDDLDISELKVRLRYHRGEWWSGWRGYWLNLPCLLLLAVCVGMAGSLLLGYFPINNPQRTWVAMMVLLPLIGLLGWWMTKIRRVEMRHMDNSQAIIDQIQAAMRRKRR